MLEGLLFVLARFYQNNTKYPYSYYTKNPIVLPSFGEQDKALALRSLSAVLNLQSVTHSSFLQTHIRAKMALVPLGTNARVTYLRAV